jgi:hypothetical protein
VGEPHPTPPHRDKSLDYEIYNYLFLCRENVIRLLLIDHVVKEVAAINPKLERFSRGKIDSSNDI